jgi:hypothetical protein
VNEARLSEVSAMEIFLLSGVGDQRDA